LQSQLASHSSIVDERLGNFVDVTSNGHAGTEREFCKSVIDKKLRGMNAGQQSIKVNSGSQR
jgi:hypothetical protein